MGINVSIELRNKINAFKVHLVYIKHIIVFFNDIYNFKILPEIKSRYASVKMPIHSYDFVNESQ